MRVSSTNTGGSYTAPARSSQHVNKLKYMYRANSLDQQHSIEQSTLNAQEQKRLLQLSECMVKRTPPYGNTPKEKERIEQEKSRTTKHVHMRVTLPLIFSNNAFWTILTKKQNQQSNTRLK